MQVQINTDSTTEGHERMAAWAEGALRERLSRYADRLTRIEVHLSETPQEGARCVLELRPAGLDPLAATGRSDTLEQAVARAADSAITVLDRTFGKLSPRKAR